MSDKSMLAAVHEATQSDKPTDEQLAVARAAGHLAGVEQGRAEGRAEGAEGAAVAERERILGIQDAAFVGQETEARAMIDDGATTPAQAALAFNAALKAKGPDHVAALRAADARVRVPANPSAAGGADTPQAAVPQTEEGWREEYANSEALQGRVPVGR